MFVWPSVFLVRRDSFLVLVMGMMGGCGGVAWLGCHESGCRNTLRTRAFAGGGLEVGVFVAVVVGDSSGRPPL